MLKGRTLVANKPGDLTGLEHIVWHLNQIPKMGDGMARAWAKAEQVIGYAVPPPWVPEGHAESEVQTPFLGAVKIVAPSLLGGRRKASLERAADAFNAWAKTIPARLEILPVHPTVKKLGLLPTVQADGDEGLALWMVWRLFFVEEWQRLRRCPQCRKWFVDTTRNKVMVRCSKSCTDKWWTLDRRREAKDSVPGGRRKTKRGGKP